MQVLLPAASLGHLAAEWILHRVNFAQDKLLLCWKVPQWAAVATTCLHCLSEPQLGAWCSLWQNPCSECAMGRLEYGWAANFQFQPVS